MPRAFFVFQILSTGAAAAGIAWLMNQLVQFLWTFACLWIASIKMLSTDDPIRPIGLLLAGIFMCLIISFILLATLLFLCLFVDWRITCLLWDESGGRTVSETRPPTFVEFSKRSWREAHRPPRSSHPPRAPPAARVHQPKKQRR